MVMASDWVGFTRKSLEHTGTVVDYLARYTRRIATTNARVLAVDDERVTLRCRDGGRHKALALDGAEFVRRFLLHVAAEGLMRVRHYGFLANRCRSEKLARIRAAIAATPPSEPQPEAPAIIPCICPRCRQPTLQVTSGDRPASRSAHNIHGGALKTALNRTSYRRSPIRPTGWTPACAHVLASAPLARYIARTGTRQGRE